MSGQSDPKPEHTATGKALMLVSHRDEKATVTPIATDAGFLAQLIACRAGFAGYRKNRREKPGIASERYKASADKAGKAVGATSRTVKVA